MLIKTKKETQNELYPLITETKLCVMLLLSNLAYPQWISVACDLKILDHVLCTTDNRVPISQNTSHISGDYTCPNKSITKYGICYVLSWFNGKVLNINVKELSHKAISQPCLRNKMPMKVIKDIETMDFLFRSIDEGQLVLLSPHSTNISLITRFSYEIIWLRAQHKKQVVNRNKAMGYFICETRLTQLRKKLGNSFPCQDDSLMSILYICDEMIDCNIKNNFTKYMHEIQRLCKEMGASKQLYCPPLLHLTYTGQCMMYSKQIPNIYEKDHILEVRNVQNKCTKNSSLNAFLINDGVLDCPDKDDEQLLREALKNTVSDKKQDICSQHGSLSCFPGSLKCFDINEICLYKLDKLNHLYPCRTGSHMKECSQFECIQHFKCPGYYCIPWGYVCDGKWDCPYGQDESNSSSCNMKRTCKNMFKCKNSQICIHIYDICNNFEDCPNSDDEALCELRNIVCPDICTCLGFALMCEGKIQNESLFTNLPHLVFHINFAKLHSFSFLQTNIFLTVLNISRNLIATVCHNVDAFYFLSVVDISFNNISKTTPRCFSELPHLYLIKIANNDLKRLAEKSFHNLGKINNIDLSNNELNTIPRHTFYNVTRIVQLNINRNPLINIVHNMFSDLDVSIVLSNSFQICCISPQETICLAQKPGYLSCLSLLPNFLVKVVVITISLVGLCLNAISAVINNNLKRMKQQEAFSTIVMSINFSDILCGLYLALLWIGNFYYSDGFILFYFQWKSSFPCLSGFLLILVFCLMVPYYISLLSLARLMVVKYPFISRFKSPVFVMRCIGIGGILNMSLAVTFVSTFKIRFSVPTSLCSPFIDPSDSIFEIKILTMLVALLHLIVLSFIGTVYFFLFGFLKFTEISQISKKKTTKSMILQLILVTGSNLIGWFPSSIIFLSSLFLPKYPVVLLIWTTLCVLPINSIINPAVFIIFNAKRKRAFLLAKRSLSPKSNFTPDIYFTH